MARSRLAWSGRAADPDRGGSTGRACRDRPKTCCAARAINQLLMRLLQREDAHPALFALYAAALERLAAGQPLEASLRRFEFGLLDDLGYGMPLTTDVDGQPIQAGLPTGGARTPGRRRAPDGVGEGGGMQARQCFRGAELLGIAAGDYQDPVIRPAAKRLARLALAPHLGSRPLRSRALFAGRGTVRG
ncbi:MAG: DNA repair protein RecO C-terminal domain-containing protein [Gammaproteobacteria bacterium]|nr:DNA repair protein RecO C-terminal domain-containing protein [Gammaproteobacteria bacterium]